MKAAIVSLLMLPALAQAGIKGKDCINIEGIYVNESGTEFEINQTGCEEIKFQDHKAKFLLDIGLNGKRAGRLTDGFLSNLNFQGDFLNMAKRLRLNASFAKEPNNYMPEMNLVLAGVFPIARGLKKDHWTGQHNMRFTLNGKMRILQSYQDPKNPKVDRLLIDTDNLEMHGVEGVKDHEQPKAFMRGANVVLQMFTGLLNAKLNRTGDIVQKDNK